MLARSISAFLLASLPCLAQAEAPRTGDAERGELLYATHCIACHSDQVHWRDNKLVTNWGNLQSEVDRWQTLSGLRWNAQDIADVARYLNNVYYRYPAGLRESTAKSDARPPAQAAGTGRTTGNGGKPAKMAGP